MTLTPKQIDVQAMVLLDIADDIIDTHPLQANALRNMAHHNLGVTPIDRRPNES